MLVTTFKAMENRGMLLKQAAFRGEKTLKNGGK